MVLWQLGKIVDDLNKVNVLTYKLWIPSKNYIVMFVIWYIKIKL